MHLVILWDLRKNTVHHVEVNMVGGDEMAGHTVFTVSVLVTVLLL